MVFSPFVFNFLKLRNIGWSDYYLSPAKLVTSLSPWVCLSPWEHLRSIFWDSVIVRLRTTKKRGNVSILSNVRTYSFEYCFFPRIKVQGIGKWDHICSLPFPVNNGSVRVQQDVNMGYVRYTGLCCRDKKGVAFFWEIFFVVISIFYF